MEIRLCYRTINTQDAFVEVRQLGPISVYVFDRNNILQASKTLLRLQ